VGIGFRSRMSDGNREQQAGCLFVVASSRVEGLRWREQGDGIRYLWFPLAAAGEDIRETLSRCSFPTETHGNHKDPR